MEKIKFISSMQVSSHREIVESRMPKKSPWSCLDRALTTKRRKIPADKRRNNHTGNVNWCSKRECGAVIAKFPSL